MTPSRAPAEAPPAAGPGPHHRAHVLGIDGKSRATLALPLAFSLPVRPDLIRRAVVAAQSHRIQPHATSPTAGVRHSVEWSGKGKGVSRTPRLMGSMRGAQAPNTVGGRPAHPPTVDRIWAKKINRRERQLAFASALAATREAKLASARGHLVPHGATLPYVLDDPVEGLRTAKDARSVLVSLELWPDVRRAQASTHLHGSGRARRRGRVRTTRRSLLVVTSQAGQGVGFRNLAGVDVVPVGRLSTEDLAPGGSPGRLTLFSRGAVEGLRARLGEAPP